MTEKEDIKDGPYETFYENGQLVEKGNFKNGKPEGLFEEYYDNGQLKTKGNYKNGEKDGLWETFDEEGKLGWSDTYKDGKFIERGHYSLSGNIKKVIKIK